MAGFITKTEVEVNAQYIKDTYGDDFYAACLAAPEGSTFLGLLIAHGKI